MKTAVMLLIRVYQKLVSPALPPSCRFHPSCSEYAHEAFDRHGLLRGCVLTAKRVLKCHPYNPGGYDPVPLLSFPGEKKVTKEKPV